MLIFHVYFLIHHKFIIFNIVFLIWFLVYLVVNFNCILHEFCCRQRAENNKFQEEHIVVKDIIELSNLELESSMHELQFIYNISLV